MARYFVEEAMCVRGKGKRETSLRAKGEPSAEEISNDTRNGRGEPRAVFARSRLRSKQEVPCSISARTKNGEKSKRTERLLRESRLVRSFCISPREFLSLSRLSYSQFVGGEEKSSWRVCEVVLLVFESSIFFVACVRVNWQRSPFEV
jgi:hypothetical protein